MPAPRLQGTALGPRAAPLELLGRETHKPLAATFAANLVKFYHQSFNAVTLKRRRLRVEGQSRTGRAWQGSPRSRY
eukprot:1472564-Pyramimonas_sp.AAC.1